MGCLLVLYSELELGFDASLCGMKVFRQNSGEEESLSEKFHSNNCCTPSGIALSINQVFDVVGLMLCSTPSQRLHE